MTSPNVVALTDANFQELTRGSEPVFIDFWAAWCPPCRAMNPQIDALADAFLGKVRVTKCDADENHEVAARMNVRSLPTFVVLKAGRVVGQIVGAVPRAKLEEMVRASLW